MSVPAGALDRLRVVPLRTRTPAPAAIRAPLEPVSIAIARIGMVPPDLVRPVARQQLFELGPGTGRRDVRRIAGITSYQIDQDSRLGA